MAQNAAGSQPGRPRPGTKTLTLQTDGAARGNPGPAGIGVVIQDETGHIVTELTQFIGHATNNEAEYSALIAGLEVVLELAPDFVQIKLDSELVVKQIKGEYRVRDLELKPFYAEAQRLLAGLAGYSISHVPRQRNREADRLSNLAIDSHI